MTATRKAKIIVAVLITLAVLVTPAAFSVSYARWTGGTNTLSGEFNVVFSGGGVISDKPFNPSDLPDSFNGGVLIKDSNGNPLMPDSEIPPISSSGYFDGDIISDSEPIYFQFFVGSDADGWEAVTLPVGDCFGGGGITFTVEHESGSVWYVLPQSGYYVISIVNGRVNFECWGLY